MAEKDTEKEVPDLNKILRAVRIAQDMTAKEVAEKMGVRSTYITDVERGDRTPRIETLDKYCRALNVSPDSVFSWRERQRKHSYTFQQLLMAILVAIMRQDDVQSKNKEILHEMKQE